MSRLIATFFYVGRVPVAPGTFGSLAALPLGWLLHGTLGPWGLIAATVAVFAVGIWAIRGATTGPDPDKSEFVIDEVAGQWIALWPLSIGLAHAGVDDPHVLLIYPPLAVDIWYSVV